VHQTELADGGGRLFLRYGAGLPGYPQLFSAGSHRTGGNDDHFQISFPRLGNLGGQTADYRCVESVVTPGNDPAADLDDDPADFF
jgi:hypothetical protein